MGEQLELKYVTVGDLKAWLFHCSGPSFLSEDVIARQRAYSIVNNPVARDETEVMSVLLVDGKPAAFTACLPDELERPFRKEIFWFSALYCKPDYQGRGYGMFLLNHLNEAHEGQVFDIDAIAETDECLKFLGYTVAKFPQYRILFSRSIKKEGVKGLLASFRERVCQKRRGRMRQRLFASSTSSGYSLDYISFLDDELFDFIKMHSGNDTMLRSQRMFNWMLSSPMVISAPVQEKLVRQNPFSSEIESFRNIAVKVLNGSQIAGFYILREKGAELSLKYLYYDRSCHDVVFDSLLAHLIALDADVLITNDKAFADYVCSKRIHHKVLELPVSVSYPPGAFDSDELCIQAGDGDMLT